MLRWRKGSVVLAAGVLAAGLGGLLLWLAGRNGVVVLTALGAGLCALGLAFAATGFLRASVLQRSLRTCAILFLNTALLVCVVEGVCRVAGVNLAALTGAQMRFERYPICFRMPTQPVPEVFFTRPGPQVWRGRVLNTLLKNLNAIDDAYPDEPEITVRYDRHGFRNPDDLVDWDIAVAGDSFTEAGYLADEQLFTSVLAARSGQRVKHLGVSYTGSFTQAAYLRHFGRAPSLRQAVMAFFEGNDLDDVEREHQELEEFAATGVRPYREVGRQTSLLKSLYHLAGNLGQFSLLPRSYATATWVHQGNRTPVSISYAPPGPASLSKAGGRALRAALDEWARTGRALGLKPWLLYLPCKRRVLHGMLEFEARSGAAVVGWVPNGLPEFVAQLCRERGIEFVDATAVLVESCREGVLTYNTIYDTHLNREGHRVVGDLLAEALDDGARKAQGEAPGRAAP